MTTDSKVKSIVESLEKLHTDLNSIDDDWEQYPDGGFDLDTINGFLSDYDRVAHEYCAICQRLLAEVKL